MITTEMRSHVYYAHRGARNFRMNPTSFKPVKLVVDPDVELLFAGRKRTETKLSAP